MLAAGPRPEEVAVAAAKLRSATAAAGRAASEASRACSLAAQSWIPLEEREQAIADADMARADADATRAELDLLLAGARTEELEAVRAEIAALEAEVAGAEDRAETTVIVSPLDAVVGDLLPECLIVLQKTDTVLVAVPLDQRVWNRVQPGNVVEITDHRHGKASGRIVHLGKSASIVGSAVSMAAFAAVPNSELRLRPGMTVRAVVATRGS
jgi:HlyD family secretion protein